jgi:hypothetical protein
MPSFAQEIVTILKLDCILTVAESNGESLKSLKNVRGETCFASGMTSG